MQRFYAAAVFPSVIQWRMPGDNAVLPTIKRLPVQVLKVGPVNYLRAAPTAGVVATALLTMKRGPGHAYRGGVTGAPRLTAPLGTPAANAGAVQFDGVDAALALLASLPAAVSSTIDIAELPAGSLASLPFAASAQTDAPDQWAGAASSVAGVTLSTTDAADASSSGVSAAIVAASAAVEQADVSQSTAVALAGALAATVDAPDSTSAALLSAIGISATTTDQPDAGTGTVQASITASASTFDAADAAVADASVPLAAAALQVDAGDAGAATANFSSAVGAALAVVEAGDIFVGGMAAQSAANAVQAEANDALLALLSGGGTGTNPGTGASVADIWSFVLPTGLSAAETLLQAHAWAHDLARIHGLIAAEPLQVGTLFRTAGPVQQSVAESGGVVTVTRQ